MVTNELLGHMSTEDLSRRYRGSFVRYGGEIILVNDFFSMTEFSYYTAKGMHTRPFEWPKLDVSRPAPQWFAYQERAYYLNYLWARQWHRGFCAANTVIRSYKGPVIRFPQTMHFEMLDIVHKETPRQLFQTTEEVRSMAKDKGCLILSPQILVIGEYDECNVYFRELNIGPLGNVVATFADELKELIGDYKNVNDVPVVPVPKRPAKKARGEADELGNIFPEVEDVVRVAQGIVRDNPRLRELLQREQARIQERAADGIAGLGPIERQNVDDFFAGRQFDEEQQ